MVITDNLFLAVIGSMLSGLIISIIFGVLTQSLLTNHVATGLALTIFGIGMSAMIGKNFVGIPGKEFPLLFINLKENVPFLGPILFGHSIIAYLSLIYTPQWIENMTGGRGWIALALVVFATWSPIKVLIGALIFGGITILQLHMQAVGLRIPVQLLSALPYIMTIIVLVVISRDSRKIKLNTPTSLGQIFYKEK